jgi:two-component system sensor histidine kinase VicK
LCTLQTYTAHGIKRLNNVMINEAATSCLALAERTKQAIFSFDVQLNQFIYVNPAFKQYAILKEYALTRVDMERLIHPQDIAFVKDAYEELLQEELKQNVEFRIVLPDATIKTVRLEAFLTSTGGRQQVITGIIEDITSFKDHSDTLNKFSNKKNALLNILSHDLLGPLGTIRNLSAIIKKKTLDSERKELSKLVNSIERISSNSVTMIRNLLAQEFLESASAELVLRRTNLVEVIRETVDGYKQSEETLQRTFNFSATKEIIQIDIDETKVVQAYNNLVSNAIKFTPENGIIDISIEEEADTVLLTVSDNGVGIPEKHHQGLFDKFTDARRTGLHGEVSHGLGMSIVKSIIDWHHGQIWFESKEHTGTTFYIRLPWKK